LGLITTAIIVFALNPQAGKGKPTSSAKPTSDVSQDRINEIWGHIDTRINNQADIWYELGEFPSCVSLLRVQSGYQPNNYEICTNLGWMLENIELPMDAMDVYINFAKGHPNWGDAMFPAGNGYFNLKDYPNAIKVLEPSLSKNPNENTYRVLAKAYERSGKFQDAIRIWELELKRFPKELTPIANIKRVKAKIAAGGK